ncbi:MAG: 16S rRNA (cytidine(1402)-2'-O)-methyltransferase [Christensenellales bacterium]|jgi:16S rRNA (cytidine1402-2'-O)-methyltransferase
MKGTLYVCATPIGNLEDITYRVVRVLKEVDYIAAEDTRRTLPLLNHLDIQKPLISCHAHNERARGEKIAQLLSEGRQVALLSDAGMPGISDPGVEVIRLARANGAKIEILPGANAALCALLLSGFDTHRFVFEGFLPTAKKERRKRLLAMLEQTAPSILYEAPHRVKRTVEELYELLGERRISISREITKLYEETVTCTLAQALDWLEEKPPRGEFVLVLEGAREEEEAVCDETIEAMLCALLEEGMSSKDAVAQTAERLGVAKNKVYALSKAKRRP